VSNPISNIDVFILCGGQGTRLRKITRDNPKPMVEMGKIPFLDILINYFSSFGFRKFILGIGYKAQVIKSYYSSKEKVGLKVVFSQEKRPLGTGGAVKNALKLVKSNPFIVVNGDSFCKFNPTEFLNFHNANKALASLLLREEPNGKEFGQVVIDQSCRIIEFKEKDISIRKSLVNAGVYVFDKRIFTLMPDTQEFSLELDLFPTLIGKDFFGYEGVDFFIDIGTPKRYFEAKRYFANKTNG